MAEVKKEKIEDKLNPIEKNDLKKILNLRNKQIEEAASMGASTENLLNDAGLLKKLMGSVNTLASTEVPVQGEGLLNIKGLSAIKDLIQGKGFNPLAPKTEPLGMDKAIQLMNMGLGEQRAQSSETRAQAGEVRAEEEQPYKISDYAAKLLKSVMELTGKNPLTGESVAETEAQAAALKETATVKARKEAELNIRQEEFSGSLENYLTIGDLLPTEEGLSRFKKGFELFGKSIGQSDVVGAAAADLQKINKQLRVKLVRQAGDVGNLNIVEQLAAEQLLFNLSDSTQLRALKRAYLVDLNRNTIDKSPSQVKQLISKWVNEPSFRTKYPEIYRKYIKQNYKELEKIRSFKSEEEARGAGLKNGERVLINGKEYIWED